MELGGKPPLNFQNYDRIAAPGEDARVLPWQSKHPVLGHLRACSSSPDTIISSFQSSDGDCVGSDT